MFLFKEDDENLRVDFKFMSGVVNDLSGGARFSSLGDEVAIFDTLSEDFVGEADEVSVLDVIMNGGIPSSFVGFRVVAVAVVVEELINFFNGH